MTLKPGLGVTQVIENDTIQSDTHDFLLTFHSNDRPISHRFRDKRRFPLKIAYFPTARVFNAPAEGLPLGIWYRRKGPKSLNDGLPDGRHHDRHHASPPRLCIYSPDEGVPLGIWYRRK